MIDTGDIYNRQSELELNIPSVVTVIGCGGVGSWVAIFAAMSGVQEIRLFDPDDLDITNLNRLPFCSSRIGDKKVDVLSDYITTIRPDCSVFAYPIVAEPSTYRLIFERTSYVFECTDSPSNQLRMCNEATKHPCGFIRAGYDGINITVTSTVTGWMKDEAGNVAETENYTVAPSWVVPSAVVAALAVAKMEKFYEHEVSASINDIGIAVLGQRAGHKLTEVCR